MHAPSPCFPSKFCVQPTWWFRVGVEGLGFGVEGLGSGVQGLGFGFGVLGLEVRGEE